MGNQNLNGFFYDLSGGINLAKTRIGLGMEGKRLFWDDSVNVETLKNQGVKSQKGSIELLKLDEEEDGTAILGLYEYPKNTDSFVFVTSSGKIYHYSGDLNTYTLKHTFTEPISSVSFVNYLDGVVIATPENAGLYFKLGAAQEFSPLNAKDSSDEAIKSDNVAVFAGRVFISSDSVLYFSALGRATDWTSPEDAGYIAKFHSSTSKIIAMREYLGCLAIYKADGVYLLSGTNPDEFSIIRFADLGAVSANSVVTENNKQYFVNPSGVFALSQTRELAQIALSSNMAINIQEYFNSLKLAKIQATQAISYKNKNQIWFFVPARDESLHGKNTQNNEDALTNGDFINTVWIFDYNINAWFKRRIPFEITAAASINGKVYSAGANGQIFIEDSGNTFAGKSIDFRFSTPFFHLGAPNVRKIVETLNFIFDEESENSFLFSVCKDYITSERTDVEFIDTLQSNTLIFVASSTSKDKFDSCWDSFNWAEPFEEAFKTEVFDSNTSVQLHLESTKLGDEFALVGIEFREVLIDE